MSAGPDDDFDLSDEVVEQVDRGRRSGPGRALARAGLASRALVYGALAVLVLQLAFGPRPDDTDQAGALRQLGAQPFGTALLWLLVLGIACFVLWRFSEVVAGPVGVEDTRAERAKSAAEGLVYVPIAVTAATIAAGDPGASEQGDRYRSLSASVMAEWTGGRWLVGAVGLVVLVVGLYLASEGVRRSFREDFAFRGNRRAEAVVVPLGIVGCTARGVVVALAGLLVVVAAVTDDPDKAGGVDAALLAVADRPFGAVVLLAVALGLLAYAAFAVGEAVWRKV